MGHKIKYINLAAQHNSIKKEIKKEIDSVFKKSAFILRKNVLKFEQKICKLLRVKCCVSLNSRTDALLFALNK